MTKLLNAAKRKYSLPRLLWYHCRLNAFRNRIRSKFPDNDIIPMNIFPESILAVGKGSYGELNVVAFSEEAKLLIGNYVSIGQHVTFVLAAEHNMNTISTYPFKVKLFCEKRAEAGTKGDIVIEDDVWIGFGATILSGVTVGQGAVIAAGAVVAENVQPYAVVGGVPAKVLKNRFSEELKESLLQVDFSQLDKAAISRHLDDLYSPLITAEQLRWLPRRET